MSGVDVVIPCYKYAHYLRNCVASVLSQRDVNVRVLIIDDCSPDATPEVGKALASEDARVTYVRNERNLGLIGTANRGVIDWAEQPYTLLLSADDALTPGALARAVETMNRYPDAGLVYGLARVISDEPMPPAEDQREFESREIPPAAFIKHSCLTGAPAPSPTAVVRTATQKQIGAYRSEFLHTSDMEMWLRFAAHGPVGAIKALQADYRWHGANMTTKYASGVLKDLHLRKLTCEIAYRDYGEKLVPEFKHCLELMNKEHARLAMWRAGEAYAANDLEGYEACRAFARECDPDFVSDGVSWRHRLKRMLGRDSARRVRAVVMSIFAGRGAAELPDASFTEFGWWPEAEEC